MTKLLQPSAFFDYDDGSSRIGDTPHAAPPRLPADFDAATYLQLNPDVVEAGIDAAVHYVYEGIKEGRQYRLP